MTTPDEIDGVLLDRADSKPYFIGVPPGWRPLVARLHDRLIELDPDYRVTQVGSHYARLWFAATFTANVDQCEQLVESAVMLSRHRCSVCGRGATATVHRSDHEPRCRDHCIRPLHRL